MKKTKIIVPAMGLLLLGTAASVTGTVAWFSINNSVNVTGMNVRTTVGSNILISATNSEASYTSGLHQAVSGVLEPVSTINGENFFYHSTTQAVAGDGHIIPGANDAVTFVPYAEGAAFDSNYGYNPTANADCFGYKDYSFYIKATNGNSDAKYLVMSRCNITYKGSAVSDKAWRVAVFALPTAKNAAAIDDATTADEDNLISILKLSAASYFESKAVASASTFDSVVNLGEHADIGEIESAQTGYFKLVVRLWLEGNDTTCNNDTYAELSGDFQLDLGFELDDADAGVNELDSVGNAVITGNNTTAGAVTLTGDASNLIANLETAVSFQWYNDETNVAISGATNSTYTNDATAKDVYCMVTTARGNVYRSNTIHLNANA